MTGVQPPFVAGTVSAPSRHRRRLSTASSPRCTNGSAAGSANTSKTNLVQGFARSTRGLVPPPDRRTVARRVTSPWRSSTTGRAREPVPVPCCWSRSPRTGGGCSSRRVGPRLFVALMRALGLEWMLTDPEVGRHSDVRGHRTSRRSSGRRCSSAARHEDARRVGGRSSTTTPTSSPSCSATGPKSSTIPSSSTTARWSRSRDPTSGPSASRAPWCGWTRTPAALDRSAPRLDEHGAGRASRAIGRRRHRGGGGDAAR